MRFNTVAASVLLALPALSTASAAGHKQKQETLREWYDKVPWKLFPNHTGWEAGFDEVFSRDVKASFNFVEHDFDSLKAFFTGVFSTVSANYVSLIIDPIDWVVVPMPTGLGGNVYSTGNETGVLKNGTVRSERDAAFGVIGEEHGKRKIIEWRESTNFV